MRSSFGHLEGADLAAMDERLGVFSLPTPKLNRNTPFEPCAHRWGLLNGQLMMIPREVLIIRVIGKHVRQRDRDVLGRIWGDYQKFLAELEKPSNF
jgi:hypothetical protein